MKKFYVIVIMILFVQVSSAQKISDPQPIAPENEMINTMPNVTLDWTAVTGIGEITYHLQLATDDAFTDLVVDQDEINISAYYPEELLFGQQYFWRVKATDDDGSSNWSSASTFTVFAMVEPKEPGDGDDEVPVRALFEWDDEIEDVDITGGISGIQVEVDTSLNFDSPIHFMVESEGIITEVVGNYMMFGTTYYWRARPFHSSDEGEWCETQMFETIFGTELDKPRNNSTDEEFDVELKWDDIEENDDDVFEYTVDISTDEAFTEPVTLITNQTKITTDFLKFSTDYWWRVKVSHINDESDWTEIFKFSTVTTVVLDSPDDGDFLIDPRPVLEWENLANVGGYQVIFSDNPDLTDATIYEVTDGNSSTYPLTSQETGKDYYWSVRAYNGSDTSNWAEPYHFYISATGINELSIINNVNIYPNPAISYINITFNVRQATELSWIITDVLGQNVTEEVLQVQTGLFSKDISVADLNRGIYFLEITQGTEKKVMKFVVK